MIRQIRKNSINKLKNSLSLRDEKNEEEIEFLEFKLFTEYVNKMLSYGIQTLKKLFYVLRLLCTSRKMRLNENIYNGYIIKDNNRKGIINIWNEFEMLLVIELKMHFIEYDVVEITDTVEADKKNRRASMSFNSGQNRGIYMCICLVFFFYFLMYIFISYHITGREGRVSMDSNTKESRGIYV